MEIPTLVTERLILEPLTIRHSGGMYNLWSKPLVCEFSGSANDFDGNPIRLPAETPSDSDKIIDFFVQYQNRSEKVRWAMITKKDKIFVGAVGFNGLGPCAEIAYHLIPDYWGRGYMSEACRVVIDYAKSTLGANSIQAYIDADNMGSIKLIRALGFLANEKSRDGANRHLLSTIN